MAKSKAKRMREKLAREGKRNPENNRGMVMSFSTHERKTKTKKDKLVHQRNKHKKRTRDFNERDNASFYFAI